LKNIENVWWQEKETLLNMIDMYKVEGASVDAFENPSSAEIISVDF
jgi:hypothetical protein